MIASQFIFPKYVLKPNDYVTGESNRNPILYQIMTEICLCGTTYDPVPVSCATFFDCLLDLTNGTSYIPV